MTDTSIPYYYKAVDMPRLIEDFPPPPMYESTVGIMSDDEMYAFQSRHLARVMEAAWKRGFFREMWTRAGIEPGDIREPSDIVKLPTYTSDDLKHSIAKNPPYGSHYPLDEFPMGTMPLKLQTSGGTTGFPRPALFDPVAWEVQAIQGARGMYAQGVRPGDIVQIPMTPSLANAAWLFVKCCHEWLGAMPVTTGSGVVTPSERQLEYALNFGVNVWMSGAEYLGRLVEVAESINFDLTQLKTKLLHTYLGNDANGHRRSVLEEAFGAPAFEAYGTHEVGEFAFECADRNGMHISEDTIWAEVVDLDTGKPLGYGEYGSLVTTALHRTWPPIIRYDLRDIFAIFPRELCSCGLRTLKLSQLRGRADEMVKIRDTNVYPRAIDAVVSGDERTTGEYLCVVTRSNKGAIGTIEAAFRVERHDSSVDADALRSDLEGAIKNVIGVRVAVEIVEQGELAPHTGYGTGEGKVKRLLDLREV